MTVAGAGNGSDAAGAGQRSLTLLRRPPSREPDRLYKTECTKRERTGRGLQDLELATLGRVSCFNDDRLHSSLGHVPPIEDEFEHYTVRTPAAAAAGRTRPLMNRGGSSGPWWCLEPQMAVLRPGGGAGLIAGSVAAAASVVLGGVQGLVGPGQKRLGGVAGPLRDPS